MRRRNFVKGIIGSATVWPLVASAQPAGKVPTIGFLGTDAAVWRPWTDAFLARLRELGWIEGRTVAIEYRWAEGRPERYTEIAAEFVHLKVDVIVTGESAARIVKQATANIPIVFAVAINPVGAGLVSSLARPGSNVTGVSLQQSDTAGKRFELLQKAFPQLRRLAVLFHVDYPESVREASEVQTAARKVGIEVTRLEISRMEDIAPLFETLNGQADALYVVQDSLVVANGMHIIIFALTSRLPAIFTSREFAQAGALMSYGPSYPALFRRTAELIDKILHGAKPADIPVEQPTKFELVVNLTTARALKLKMPESFLSLADQVIE